MDLLRPFMAEISRVALRCALWILLIRGHPCYADPPTRLLSSISLSLTLTEMH
jgi:hypothetical protein